MGERFTLEELRDYLRQECAEVGGMAEWARRHGIDKRHLSHVLTGVRYPGSDLLSVLGLRKITMYEDTGSVRPAGSAPEPV